MERHKVVTNYRKTKSFFDQWNPEMAYILGLFASDGSMYKNPAGSYYIAFYSTDLELIESIKKITGFTNQIEIKKSIRNKTSYCMQIGSKRIYSQLQKLGFTPNKSLTLSFPEIPENVFCHFLRGYFDGDGCAYFNPNVAHKIKNKTYRTKVMHIMFTSGSLDFSSTLRSKLVETVGTGPGYLYFHYRAFTLRFSLKDVVKLFNFMYPSDTIPYLRRKKQRLEEGLKQFGIEV